MEPIDYTMDVISPINAALSGYNNAINQGIDRRGAIQAQDIQAKESQQNDVLFGQGQEDRVAGQEAAAQAAIDDENLARQMQGDMNLLLGKVKAGTATSADFMEFTAAYPDIADDMKGQFDGYTAERKDAETLIIGQAYNAIKSGQPKVAVDLLEQRAIAAENAGMQEDADSARSLAATIEGDASAGEAALALTMNILNPDLFEKLAGVSGKSVQSTIDIGSGTTVTIFTDGSKQVSDAAGTVLSDEAATAAIKAAEDRGVELKQQGAAATAGGRLQTEIDLGGEAAATVESGKQAIAKSGEAFDALSKVNNNILTIDTAIAALDAGANAGAIARYAPDISGASASLTNAMNRLGLDVIGSVTFGALSEAEMKLAMETAVPRNLDDAELRQWLVEKKAAQVKASDALYAAAQYLGTPGNTLTGWLKEKKQTDAAPAIPAGVDPAVWNTMTPEEKALFQ